MSSTFHHHRGRFGFHPCDYELFLKLKYLKKHYWITLRQFHRWHRWNRKEPQNRHGSEPEYCDAFVEPRPWAKLVKAGFKHYPRTVVDHGLLDRFVLARTPSAEPIEPFSDDAIREIESLYAKVKQHFDGKKQAVAS